MERYFKAIVCSFTVLLALGFATTALAETLSAKLLGVMFNIAPREGTNIAYCSPSIMLRNDFYEGAFQALTGPNDWRALEQDDGTYAITYKTWSDYYWSFDVRERKLYEIKGEPYAGYKGKETLLKGVEFLINKHRTIFAFSDARLLYEPGTRVFEIWSGDMLLHRTGIARVVKTGAGAYQIAFRVAGRLESIEVDFERNTVQLIDTAEVMSDPTPLVLDKPYASGPYRYYGGLKFTVTPARQTYRLDGTVAKFDPSINLAMESYVLNYGIDWEVMVSSDSGMYDIRNMAWRNYYYRLDKVSKKLFAVKGGEFGGESGKMNQIKGTFFEWYPKSENISVSPPETYMEFELGAQELKFFVGSRLFQTAKLLGSEKLDTDVYRLTFSKFYGSFRPVWVVDFAMQTIKLEREYAKSSAE